MKYTNTKNNNKIAERNFKKHISLNSYPGRGIVLGKNRDDSWVLIYWIMGRSPQSRNRVLKYENGILRTEAISSSLNHDQKFIIYNAMRDLDGVIVVSNGSHTDRICEKINEGENFFTSLESEKHESDSPNYTSRIAGLIKLSEPGINMGKICKSDFSFNRTSYHYFRYPIIQPGFGYCLTTYMVDGDPPSTFQGDPILIPLQGNAENIANKFWNELNAENRISLFTREIKKLGEENLKIINRFG